MELKLQHFRALVSVADAGSIRAAARSSGVTQAALTRSLQEAQGVIDEPLFDREDGRLVLTPAGEVVLSTARTITRAMNATAEELTRLADSRRQRVSVAVAQPLGCKAVPQALRWFRARYAGPRLSLYDPSSMDAISGLRTGLLDFAVIEETTGAREDEFQQDVVGSFACSVVARRGHPLIDACSPEGAADFEWICPGTQGAIASERFLRLFDAAELPRPRRFIHADYFVATQLVAAGDALTVLPQALLGEFGLDQLAVLELLQPPALTLAVVRRRDLPLSDSSEYLAECIVEAARAL
ncbi:LysR family transcriptional regulator [Ramlibacter sp. AN1015]|uniref:LysR family transcriptional regulator n=1 Tax=Ramlibacter sp. AN1015 TaxID=3133428 RepID=UPI0030C64C2D